MAAGSKDLASSVMEWRKTPTTQRRIGLISYRDGIDCRRPLCGTALLRMVENRRSTSSPSVLSR
jgi:hypothetical protein